MTYFNTFYSKILPRVLTMTPRTKLFKLVVARLRTMGYKITKARYKGNAENFKLRKDNNEALNS